MISVVIPAYNEEKIVGDVVASFLKLFDDLSLNGSEIVVVDDGSDDDTAKVAEAAGAKVLRKIENLGYGHSLKLGIRLATNDTIVIIDADGTYPAEELPKLLEHFVAGYDLVVGARTGSFYRESWYKFPLRKILKLLVEYTTGRRITDVNSGFRIFSKKTILPYLTSLSDVFSFTTSMTLVYMLSRKSVKYTNIPYNDRIGATKVRLFRDSLRTLQYIAQVILLYNPLKLFLALSFLLFAMGVVGFVSAGFGLGVGLLLGWQSMLASVIVLAIGFLADLVRQTRPSVHTDDVKPRDSIQ